MQPRLTAAGIGWGILAFLLDRAFPVIPKPILWFLAVVGLGFFLWGVKEWLRWVLPAVTMSPFEIHVTIPKGQHSRLIGRRWQGEVTAVHVPTTVPATDTAKTVQLSFGALGPPAIGNIVIANIRRSSPLLGSVRPRSRVRLAGTIKEVLEGAILLARARIRAVSARGATSVSSAKPRRDFIA